MNIPTVDVRGGLAGFIDFIRTQGVVGLAIGVVLGGAVGKVVASIVNDIVMPMVSIVLGSAEGIKGLSYHGIMFGNFIANLLDFAIIAAVVYFGVKLLGLDKLDKPKA